MAYDPKQCDPGVDEFGAYEKNACQYVMTPDEFVAAVPNPPYPPFDFARWENSGDLAGFMAAWDEYQQTTAMPMEQAAEKEITQNTDYFHLTQTVDPFKLDQYPEVRAMRHIAGYNYANSIIFDRVFRKLSEAAGVNPYEPYDEKYAQWEATHGGSNPAPYQATSYAAPRASPINTSTAPISTTPKPPTTVDSIVSQATGWFNSPGVTVGGTTLSPWLLVGGAVVAYFLFFKDKGGR